MSELLDKKDLTRWNRAGLERFRYVDGNAVTYLETLRLLMKQAFTESGVNQWSALDTEIPVPTSETAAEKRSRWQAQYKAERRDYAWEILRTYARSTHVLMEYVDTYANENFLRTATEWENVKRLVEMIDYHPNPPASAETPIVLIAKEGLSGTVEKGFAFKNKPVDGSKPAIFETLSDIDVDVALNTLKAKDWNKSQNLFSYDATSRSATFELAEPTENVSVGTLGVLVIEPEDDDSFGIAVTVTEVADTQLTLYGETLYTSIPSSLTDFQVRLLLKPEEKREPLISGSQVIELSEGHGLSIGAVISWYASGWKVAKVLDLEGNRVRLSSNAPYIGEEIYTADFAVKDYHSFPSGSEYGIILPTHRDNLRKNNALWDQNLNSVSDSNHNHGTYGYELDFFASSTRDRLYYVPEREPVATVTDRNIQDWTFTGKSKKFKSGDWLVAQNDSLENAYRATQIEEIIEHSDSFDIVPDRTVTNVEVVHGLFSVELKPKDYDKNHQPIFLTDSVYRSDINSTIPLDLDSYSDLLAPGRQIMLVGKLSALALTVKAVDTDNELLVVEPAIPGSEKSSTGETDNFTRYDSVLYVNVVNSGHGETHNKIILGSGDATKTNQSFHLDVNDISFVADSKLSSGVRADLAVKVDNRTYTQVSTLIDSEPEDPHFVVQMREDSTLDIEFGDGTLGRRLPSGTNNIVVVYRTGTGLAGNLSAYSLEKTVKPHYLIESVAQPILASGGNDMESAESMREHAPSSVLTLERAVSVTDFSNLAQANSSVWQAKAVMQQPALSRSNKVNVAIVPAGGGDLGSLSETIASTLNEHCLPGVSVTVLRYQAILLALTIIVNVKTDEYDIDEVELAVKQKIATDFSLKNASLGKPFYRSQIIQSVESVTGVENCQCQILDSFIDEYGATVKPDSVALSLNGYVKRISPSWNQLVYFESSTSALNLTMQTFVP
ncbi:baseplate J/gp47 family protein [Aurantivibrio plasticivorans]